MVKRIERPVVARPIVNRPIVIRLGIAWLAILVALGVWHGYGEWLLGGVERVL